jgi:hypothetical protein
LAEFPDDERAVLEAAAVMGRHFEWEILPAASGQPTEVVSRTVARAGDRVLVTADGARFQFCHALTRKAVLTSTLPPRLRRAAADALAAVDAAHLWRLRALHERAPSTCSSGGTSTACSRPDSSVRRWERSAR